MTKIERQLEIRIGPQTYKALLQALQYIRKHLNAHDRQGIARKNALFSWILVTYLSSDVMLSPYETSARQYTYAEANPHQTGLIIQQV